MILLLPKTKRMTKSIILFWNNSNSHLKLNNSSKYFAGKINKKQDSYINMDQGFLPILTQKTKSHYSNREKSILGRNWYNILILLLLSSCLNLSQKQINNSNSLPSFYISPKQNNLSYLYGIGEGYNLNSAIKSALGNISAKLITNVSANSKLLAKSYNNNNSEEYREEINQKLEKITFNNYQISNSANFNNKIYVEIAIDRNNFIKQKVRKLQNLNQRFSNLTKNLKNKNIIDQYRNLKKIQNKLHEATILNIILESIQYSDMNYQENYQKYLSYQNLFDNLTENMIFKIDPKSNKKIARIIKKSFSDQKLKLTNQNIKGKNIILIKIEQEEISDKIYDNFIIKLNVTLSLINQGKILGSNLITVNGASLHSKKAARNNAILELYQKIKEISLIE
jgi:hypothetical protein